MQDNLEPSYISHSELQFGRAEGIGRWARNLPELLFKEFSERLHQGPLAQQKVMVLEQDDRLLAVSLVTFNHDVPVNHAVIEDLIVQRSERGKGIGQAAMEWILRYAKSHGAKRVFLEAGLSNTDAHSFFERNNFHQVSLVMMATLE